jgi:hypothetical protein
VHLVAVLNDQQPRIVRWKLGAGLATATQELLTQPYQSAQPFPDGPTFFGVMGIVGQDTVGTQRLTLDQPKVPISGNPLVPLVPFVSVSPSPSQTLRAFGLAGVPVASFALGSISETLDPIQGASEPSSLYAPARFLVEGNLPVALWVNSAGELRRKIAMDAAATGWGDTATLSPGFALLPDSFVAVSDAGDELALVRDDGAFCFAFLPGMAIEDPSFACGAASLPAEDGVLPFTFGRLASGTHVVAWSRLVPPGDIRLAFTSQSDNDPVKFDKGLFDSPVLVGAPGGLYLVVHSLPGLAVAPVNEVDATLGAPQEIFQGTFGDFSALTVNYPAP